MTKKTILIVEDTLGFDVTIDYQVKKLFPADQFEVIKARTFMDAAKILCDNKRTIGAILVDNGFPLFEGGDRTGSVITDKPIPRNDRDNHMAEGNGEGALLMRFIRTGDPGALSHKSQTELQGLDDIVKDWLGSHYTQRMQELKSVPVLWNSADANLDKVAIISAVARGETIDPHDIPKGKKKKHTIEKNVPLEVDPNTFLFHKNYSDMLKFVLARLSKKSVTTPVSEFPLCAEHSMAPSPAMEFTLAVKHQMPETLHTLKEKYGNQIPALVISAALGDIAIIPGTIGIELLNIMLQYPNADVNAYHVIHISEPPIACTPLYQAVAEQTDIVVERLLKVPGIHVSKDTVSCAEAGTNQKIKRLLNEHVSKHGLSQQLSHLPVKDLPDPTKVQGGINLVVTPLNNGIKVE